MLSVLVTIFYNFYLDIMFYWNLHLLKRLEISLFPKIALFFYQLNSNFYNYYLLSFKKCYFINTAKSFTSTFNYFNAPVVAVIRYILVLRQVFTQ